MRLSVYKSSAKVVFSVQTALEGRGKEAYALRCEYVFAFTPPEFDTI